MPNQFCLLTQQRGENCYMPVRCQKITSGRNKFCFPSQIYWIQIRGEYLGFLKHWPRQFWFFFEDWGEWKVMGVILTSLLCSRIRGVSQCPLLDATRTLLGLGKEFEANSWPASLTGQLHQGGLLKSTEVDPAAFCAFLMAFPLCPGWGRMQGQHSSVAWTVALGCFK